MNRVKKRLHISGLTPAITANDINARLGGFGTVIELDGFGLLNAVGLPRKFGYVTLEATESNIARCLNLLSGTTWKGAKLRIGEAKPDFSQRLDGERKRAAEAEQERPSKHRRVPRGVQGFHAEDMSTVDVQNVKSHVGWKKTALSHLIRPMKMRPSHPLPEPHAKKTDDVPKKFRKKSATLDPPTRARVRIIDPQLYNPVHLREDMLDAVVISTHPTKPRKPVLPIPSPPPSEPSGEKSPRSRHLTPSTASELALDIESGSTTQFPDFDVEKKRDLGLIISMFGEDEREWDGKESIDDVDPAIQDVVSSEGKVEVEVEVEVPDEHSKKAEPSLRDMFKPQEEQAGFSLLSGIRDLDLDPTFDLDLDLGAPAPVSEVPSQQRPVPHIPDSTVTAEFTLDPSLPLFFPQPDNPRTKDIFTLSRAEGWEFGRSDDADTIRKRWDEIKGPLTREWKKRAREAVKARRRRYGAVAGGEEI